MGEKQIQRIPTYLNFLMGGTAGAMGYCIVHPIDVIKTGMQIAGTTGQKGTITGTVKDILEKQGPKGLYKGLSAQVTRQLTYTTTRLGLYNTGIDYMKKADGTLPTFVEKTSLSVLAGACGAIVGNPADLCLIRMQADARLSASERRNYTHIGNALLRIIREEGVLTLWRGCFPTIAKACVANASQLATYSQAKQLFFDTGRFKEGILLHFCAAMSSGFITSFNSCPLDILKTRLQNMKVRNGIPEYKGTADAFMKIVTKEGALTLWKGFLPYYLRTGGHTVCLFLFLEQLMDAYKTISGN